jgi:Domain of unknown function (DUF4010)
MRFELLKPQPGWEALPRRLGISTLLTGRSAILLRFGGGAAIFKTSQAPPDLKLEQPFSLKAALEFGVIFLVLSVAGVLAQRSLGVFGFYAVSIAGGLLSSASAVAAAGTAARTPSSIVACRSKSSGVSHTDKRVYQYSDRRSGRWATSANPSVRSLAPYRHCFRRVRSACS